MKAQRLTLPDQIFTREYIFKLESPEVIERVMNQRRKLFCSFVIDLKGPNSLTNLVTFKSDCTLMIQREFVGRRECKCRILSFVHVVMG